MWEEREWIESHLDVNEIRNQVTDVNKLLTGGLNHPCQRPTGRRLSAFVQIPALFQFYVTDTWQTSASFAKSVNLKKERALFLLLKPHYKPTDCHIETGPRTPWHVGPLTS